MTTYRPRHTPPRRRLLAILISQALAAGAFPALKPTPLMCRAMLTL